MYGLLIFVASWLMLATFMARAAGVGIPAVRQAPARFPAVLALLGGAVLINLAAMTLTFSLASLQPVHPFVLLLAQFLGSAALAVVAGQACSKRYFARAQPWYGIAAAAIFLAAAFVPVAWFVLGNALERLFGVHWIY